MITVPVYNYVIIFFKNHHTITHYVCMIFYSFFVMSRKCHETIQQTYKSSLLL